MPLKHRPVEQEHSDLGLERLVFFSDAVMAIAITLLTVDLKLPELGEAATSLQLLHALAALTPRFLSFLISFLVIGVYWSSHHRYFNCIARMDGRLAALNMFFLLSIALMPFVAGLLGQYYYLPIGPAVYAAAMAFTGFSMNAIWWYASHKRRLLKPEVSDAFIRTRRVLLSVGPIAFLLSIPLAWVDFVAIITAWWMSPVIAIITLRIMQRRTRRLARTQKPSRA